MNAATVSRGLTLVTGQLKTGLLCPLQPSKTNTQYHKLFKDVSGDELLIKSRVQFQIKRHDVKKCFY